LEEELGRVEVVFTGSPYGETICWKRGSGVGTGFWDKGRGEYMEVEVLDRSIMAGSYHKRPLTDL